MEFEIDNIPPKFEVDPEFLNRMMECDYSEPAETTFESIPYIEPSEVVETPKGYDDSRYIPTQMQPHVIPHNKDRDEDKGFGLFGKPLAMVYAPIQIFRNIYDPEDALAHGTIFKELDFPWNQGCSACQFGSRRDGMRRG